MKFEVQFDKITYWCNTILGLCKVRVCTFKIRAVTVCVDVIEMYVTCAVCVQISRISRNLPAFWCEWCGIRMIRCNFLKFSGFIGGLLAMWANFA